MHFIKDFARKNILQAPGLEPTTFQLMPSCLSITFLSGICISLIDHIGCQYYGEPTVVIKRTTAVTSSITQVIHQQPCASWTTLGANLHKIFFLSGKLRLGLEPRTSEKNRWLQSPQKILRSSHFLIRRTCCNHQRHDTRETFGSLMGKQKFY